MKRSLALLALATVSACQVHQDPFEDPPASCPVAPALPPQQGLSDEVNAPQPRTQPAPPQPYLAGHGLVTTPNALLVADEANGNLVALDRTTLAVTATWSIGARASQIVSDGSVAWVTVRGENRVVRLDIASGKTDSFVVGVEPTGIALNATKDMLVVAVAGTRKLVVLDPTTGALLGEHATGERPLAVAMTTAGDLTVVHQTEPPMLFKLGNKGQLTDNSTGTGLTLDSMGNHCLDQQGAGVRATRAVAAVADPETAAFAIAHIVVSPGSDASVEAANQPVDPDACNGQQPGGNAYGSGGGGGGAGVSKGMNGTMMLGSQACSFGARRPAEAAVTRVSTVADVGSAWSPLEVGPVRLGGRALAASIDQPSDLAFHPTMRVALMPGMGSDNAVLIDTQSGQTFGVITLADDAAPRAVAFSEDGTKAWLLETHRFRVAEVDLTPVSTMKFGAPLQLKPARESALFGKDPLPLEARLGRRTFFNARNVRLSHDNQFACATCHLDGGDDKQVWFIADGPRQTPVLAGRLNGTGPFNWKGSQVVLKNNMKDTVHRMGGKGLTQAELDSLEKFLLVGLTLPPNPNLAADGKLTEQQARGKLVFDDPTAGCASCHTPGSGTDGALHDVGTGTQTDDLVAKLRSQSIETSRAFNTPTLRGLFTSAPYFHDGSAATLEAVLQRTSDSGLMGNTKGLSSQSRADLIAYLLTL
jgi:DNA-binding beta-propeller fold protein YncE/mono/diheme cytochrome c family protein